MHNYLCDPAFKKNIFILDNDAVVTNKSPVIDKLLNFCELEKNDFEMEQAKSLIQPSAHRYDPESVGLAKKAAGLYRELTGSLS